MISKRTLQLAAECITECMKPLAMDANLYKMGARETHETSHAKYQQLADALREIEAEIRQGRMEI